MSRRKDMSSKLKSSLEAEDQTLDDRFAKADVALGQRKTGSRKKAPKTQQVVRDTFSMPPADHDLIQELRQQLIQEHGVVLNKSEILRAGLHALQELSAEQRLAAAQSIETLKPGRKAL